MLYRLRADSPIQGSNEGRYGAFPLAADDPPLLKFPAFAPSFQELPAMPRPVLVKALAAAAFGSIFSVPQGFAQASAALAGPTYADLVDLADHAPQIGRASCRERVYSSV